MKRWSRQGVVSPCRRSYHWSDAAFGMVGQRIVINLSRPQRKFWFSRSYWKTIWKKQENGMNPRISIRNCPTDMFYDLCAIIHLASNRLVNCFEFSLSDFECWEGVVVGVFLSVCGTWLQDLLPFWQESAKHCFCNAHRWFRSTQWSVHVFLVFMAVTTATKNIAGLKIRQFSAHTCV